MGPSWRFPPHLRLIERVLLEAIAERDGRLIVTLPPRHGKSELVSAAFPAWFLGTYPDKRVILASYGADFAASWGRKARDILQVHGHEFGVRVREGSSAADQWLIAGHKGGMQTAGVGGQITGKGADLVVIDDPIKNDAEAVSLVSRDHLWEWYRATLRTRLEPGGTIAVIMTRWHPYDLVARLVSESGEKWREIRLPAIAEEDDPLGRPLGEPLWPDRFGVEAMDATKAALGRWWNALYQQSPMPDVEGALWTHTQISELRVTEAPKEFRRVVVGVDPSGGGKDECGIIVCGQTHDGDVYVLDDRSGRFPSVEWARRAIQAYHEYKADRIVVETNFGGDNVTANIAAVDPQIPVRDVKASRGKVIRADPVATQYAQKRVHHVGDFPQLERQMCEWTPQSGYSPDRLDALVWGVTELLEGSSALAFLAQIQKKPVALTNGLATLGYSR
ncbi:MAG: terminase family protein [Candidatus Dormiibacterota bacterium]